MDIENQKHFNQHFSDEIKTIQGKKFLNSENSNNSYPALPTDSVALPICVHSRSPVIEIIEKVIKCDHRQLNLSRCPKLLRLFEVFLESDHSGISRIELIRRIYGMPSSSRFSMRQEQNRSANLVKLLSRARIMATMVLGGPRDVGLDWFTFDASLDGWHLYTITSPYIRSRIVYVNPTTDAGPAIAVKSERPGEIQDA